MACDIDTNEFIIVNFSARGGSRICGKGGPML